MSGLLPQTHLLWLRAHFGQRDQVLKGGWMAGGADPSRVCHAHRGVLSWPWSLPQTHLSFFLFSILYKDLVTSSFIHNYLFETADFHFWPCIENLLLFWSFSTLLHSAPQYKAILLTNIWFSDVCLYYLSIQRLLSTQTPVQWTWLCPLRGVFTHWSQWQSPNKTTLNCSSFLFFFF